MKDRGYRALAGAGVVVAWCALAFAGQDRAQEVISRAREAIGGQARLAAVTALSVKASSRRTSTVFIGSRTKPTIQTVTADLEIQILLPDKFLVMRDGLGGRQIDGVNGARLILERAPNVHVVIGDPENIPRMAATRQRQLLRYLIAWLLIAPDSYGLRFSDGGVATVEGTQLNVVEAKAANDFAARLFFDGQSRLVMIAYQDPPASAPPTPVAEPRVAGAEQPVFKSLEGANPPPMPTRTRNLRIRLADYRTDDAIMFPHLMTFESDGEVTDTWTIKRFTVNPKLDPRYFLPK